MRRITTEDVKEGVETEGMHEYFLEACPNINEIQDDDIRAAAYEFSRAVVLLELVLRKHGITVK